MLVVDAKGQIIAEVLARPPRQPLFNPRYPDSWPPPLRRCGEIKQITQNRPPSGS
jgi:hypothetical protein